MTQRTGIAQVDRLLAEAEETRNERGNRIRQGFHHTERYLFDCNLDFGEWDQFDTENDAWYFGVWVNKRRRQFLQYVEGDVFFTQCDDDEHYDAEIAAMCEFYEPAPALIAIDLEKGERTEYYEDRTQFFIDPAKAPASGIPETNPEGD